MILFFHFYQLVFSKNNRKGHFFSRLKLLLYKKYSIFYLRWLSGAISHTTEKIPTQKNLHLQNSSRRGHSEKRYSNAPGCLHSDWQFSWTKSFPNVYNCISGLRRLFNNWWKLQVLIRNNQFINNVKTSGCHTTVVLLDSIQTSMMELSREF